jgi:RNA polymerase sigma factor (sigma-70 family)
MNEELARSLEPLHAEAYGWAVHCCEGSHADASDVLQNAYLKVLQSKATWQGRATLKTWWFGVIRLSAKEERRRRRFRESLPGEVLRLCFHEVTPPPVPPPCSIELDETARELRACLKQLPARQAEILHLVFYQDLTLSEAAEIRGVSLGSARTHYDRAKTRLRELLPPSSLES